MIISYEKVLLTFWGLLPADDSAVPETGQTRLGPAGGGEGEHQQEFHFVYAVQLWGLGWSALAQVFTQQSLSGQRGVQLLQT